MHAGYYHEAQEWQNWLLRAIAGSAEQVQSMYGVAGERHLAEWEVPWLAGYQGASPVRVGNAAFGQQQLDIYGELADALHQAREGKLPKNEPAIDLQRTSVRAPGAVWQEPDEGIWEVRAPRRHFTHSKVMAWVAFDRTIKSAEKFGLKARWSIGEQYAGKSTMTSAAMASTAISAVSCNRTDRRIWMRVCCWSRSSVSCRHRTHACVARLKR